MKFFTLWSKLPLAVVVIARRCGACSMTFPSVPVAPSFEVKVENQGHPVKGLKVNLYDFQRSRTAAVVETDKDGFALFRGIQPGSYMPSPDHGAGMSGVEVVVRPDGPANATVLLGWPGITTILVRSLKGTIRGPVYFPGRSGPTLSLDLLEGTSGRTLKSLETTEGSEFAFDGSGPGLYFLRVNPSAGLIAVAVDSDAPTDHLDVDLGWTSCGLWYVDQSSCSQSSLHIERLSGQVLDFGGVAIADAGVFLFDRADELVDELRSDSSGKFASPQNWTGSFELVVTKDGFTPLRRTVEVEPTDASTGFSPLNLQLGFLGKCSSASR